MKTSLWCTPESNFEQFSKRAISCVERFAINNNIINLIDSKELELSHFHNRLNTLFHQVYMSSSSFALAGSMCDSRYFKIREYLFHHAEEEQDHFVVVAIGNRFGKRRK